MRKIYVASSWRNNIQPNVVKELMIAGHEVYDFKNPSPGNNGFSWSQIDPNWQNWTQDEYKAALEHPIAIAGYASDFKALDAADTCVLVLPCNRSAHTEAGYMAGQGKEVYVLLDDSEPELMYKVFTSLCSTVDDIIDLLDETEPVREPNEPDLMGRDIKEEMEQMHKIQRDIK